MEHLAGPLIVIAIIAWFVIETWLENRAAEARTQRELEERRLQLEAQKALLEKFSTAEDLTRYSSTEEGRLLVDRLRGGAEAVVPPNPMAGINALIVLGLLATGLGVAFLILAMVIDQRTLFFPGFLLGIPGLGLLIGAAVSYHLKKKWGLLKCEPATPAV